MSNTNALLPVEILRSTKTEYPRLWELIDAVRAHGNLTWPDYVFCPPNVVYSVLRLHRDQPDLVAAVRETAMATAMAAWRPTQSVYRFDATLRAALEDTPLDRELPADALRRLPEWCVCLELTENRVYAFVSLSARAVRGGPAVDESLAVCLVNAVGDNADAYGQTVMSVPLTGTLTEGIDIALGTGTNKLWAKEHATKEGAAAAFHALLRPIVALTLYLCASEPDIRDARGTDRMPRRAVPKTTAKRPTPFVQGASNPTFFETGYRIGAALRRAQVVAAEQEIAERGVRKDPLPHVRRAHWHTVLSGPRNEERVRELRWFPPIPVNLDDVDDLVPVVRKVKP